MLSEHINQDIFENNSSKSSSREGFGKGLFEVAGLNRKVVALSADLSDSLQMTDFKKTFADRYIEVGVAEQNLVAVASGLASMGKIPYIGSFAVWSPGRNWEQIRTTVCYNNQSIKIIGSHAGLSVGADGGSHQALEDIALMRVLPNMIVISPSDFEEARKATIKVASINSPVYIRLSRNKIPQINKHSSHFEIGKANLVFHSKKSKKIDVAILATGEMVYQALLSAKKLDDEGVSVKVLNIHTIKPLDEKAILDVAHEAGAVVTCEDHQIFGGFGSAVSELLSLKYPIPIEFIGVKDKFGQSGSPDELYEHYGLSVKHIYLAAKKAILRK